MVSPPGSLSSLCPSSLVLLQEHWAGVKGKKQGGADANLPAGQPFWLAAQEDDSCLPPDVVMSAFPELEGAKGPVVGGWGPHLLGGRHC